MQKSRLVADESRRRTVKTDALNAGLKGQLY